MSALKMTRFLLLTTLTVCFATANAQQNKEKTVEDIINDSLGFFENKLTAQAEKVRLATEEERAKLAEAKKKGERAFADQLAKAKATLSTKLDIVDGKFVGLKLHAKQKVEPSYLPSQTQRTDSWNIQLDLHNDVSQTFGVDIHPGINLTYLRHYSDIWTAVKGDYFWRENIPWNADIALNKMNENEVMRIEVYLDGNLGLGKESEDGDAKGTVGIGINKSARILVDVYRLDEGKIRLRTLALRNHGTINWSAMAALDGIFNQHSKIVRRALNRIFKCVPFNFHGEASPIDEPAFDTFMADYIIDLNTVEGKKAYNEAINYVRNIKAWAFAGKLIGLMFKDRDKSFEIIKAELEKMIAPIENQISAEKVERMFKGISETSVNNPVFDSNCFRIWEIKEANYNSRTRLTTFDNQNRANYVIYESTLLESVRKFVSGYFERLDTRSINIAFNADKSFKPTKLTDLIVTINGKDSDFSKKDLNNLKENAKANLPEVIYSKINWDQISTGDTKTLLKYRMDIIFSKDTLTAFAPFTYQQHLDALQEYFKNFPNNDDLTCNQTPGGSCDMGREDYRHEDRFQDDMISVAMLLSVVLNPETDANERLRSFATLRHNKLFQAIGVGYLIKLLEKHSPMPIESLISMRFSSNDNDNNSVNVISGEAEISKDYLALEYQLNLINDRSLDMRVERDETGRLRPIFIRSK